MSLTWLEILALTAIGIAIVVLAYALFKPHHEASIEDPAPDLDAPEYHQQERE